MSDLEGKIQKELVRRVLELDGKRQKFSLSNLAVESTVDALVEFTDVTRDDVEVIAREVRLQYETQPSPEQRRREFIHDWGLKLAGAVIGSLLVIGIYQWMRAEQSVNAMSSLQPWALSKQDEKMRQKFIIHAQLSSAVAALVPIRLMVLTHYQEFGAYPESLSAMGLDPAEMTDNVNIKSVRLENEGIIVAELEEKFGNSKRIALIPSSTMGGLQTHWECVTNVDADAFANKRYPICEPKSRLEF